MGLQERLLPGVSRELEAIKGGGSLRSPGAWMLISGASDGGREGSPGG